MIITMRGITISIYPEFGPKARPIAVAERPMRRGAIPGGLALKGSVVEKTVVTKTPAPSISSKNIDP